MLSVLSFICVSLFLSLSSADVFPSGYTRCNTEDNVCLPKAMEDFIKKAHSGISSLNVPSLDPLLLPIVKIEQGKESSVNVKLVFKDCKVYGITNAKINKTVGFSHDPTSSKYEIYARIPRLQLLAKYNVNGRVLILPVVGNGQSNLTFDDVDIKLKFQPKIIKRDGKRFINIPNNKFKLSFETQRLYIYLGNLFNGNQQLSDTTNTFLNENWKIIFQELKPAIKQTFTEILTSLINNILDKLPYDEMFNNLATSLDSVDTTMMTATEVQQQEQLVNV